MLFSEIYGSYYQAVAAILREAAAGTLTQEALRNIVWENAFQESLLTIPDALTSGRWPLLEQDLHTPLTHAPSMPITDLQKRWMKAILSDPRVRLFGLDDTGLSQVEPLFRQEWLVYFDRYSDGDPFTDSGYIRRFQTILTALREKKQLEVTFRDRKGLLHHLDLSPGYLEYSEKDDRFRLVGESFRPVTVNLSQLETCHLLDLPARRSLPLRHDQTLTLSLRDERKALERVLLHFSHLEKETKRLDETHYQITLHYDLQDETEILIRILSFGPALQVIAPLSFREKIRERLQKQAALSQFATFFP